MLHDDVRRQLNQWEHDLEAPLWHANETVIVGVSGGPDSLALLHMLAQNGLHDPRRLLVGHLDHRLRKTSAQEAQAIVTLCAQWELDCVVDAVDVAAMAQRRKLSIEEAARLARYEFLGNLARGAGCRTVIVGHTADDQAETVLMHFIRGTGLDGLSGMAPVSSLPGFEDLSLVRPFLAVTRQDVANYCATYNLDPVHDPSNEDLTYFRNRLRHELLPLLASYNPQIRERMLRTAEVVRAEVNYLEGKTEEVLDSVTKKESHDHMRLIRQAWRQLPLNFRRRTLREAVWRLRRSLRDVSYAPIELARSVAETGHVGARANLPGSLELVVEYETFLIGDAAQADDRPEPQVKDSDARKLEVPGVVGLRNGWQIQADPSTMRAFSVHCESPNRWHAYVDADLAGPMLVRARQRGERMQPLGMQGDHAKLSDMMIDAKLPRALRALWPLVANRAHPIWLVGLHIDERVRIHKGTQRVIQLRCDLNDTGGQMITSS